MICRIDALPFSGAIGYILGVRDRKGAVEAASWHVWGDLDDCRTARRVCEHSPMRRAESLFACELHWPAEAPQADPPSWYLAVAQKRARLEVAEYSFLTTLAEAERAVDDIRQRYPEYTAGVTRFLVLDVREVQS